MLRLWPARRVLLRRMHGRSRSVGATQRGSEGRGLPRKADATTAQCSAGWFGLPKYTPAALQLLQVVLVSNVASK